MAAPTNTEIDYDYDQVSTTQNDIETEREQRLRVSQHAALRNVTYRVDEDTVILYGRVPSYYLKQLAQVKATTIPGIARVDNWIEVAVS